MVLIDHEGFKNLSFVGVSDDGQKKKGCPTDEDSLAWEAEATRLADAGDTEAGLELLNRLERMKKGSDGGQEGK